MTPNLQGYAHHNPAGSPLPEGAGDTPFRALFWGHSEALLGVKTPLVLPPIRPGLRSLLPWEETPLGGPREGRGYPHPPSPGPLKKASPGPAPADSVLPRVLYPGGLSPLFTPALGPFSRKAVTPACLGHPPSRSMGRSCGTYPKCPSGAGAPTSSMPGTVPPLGYPPSGSPAGRPSSQPVPRSTPSRATAVPRVSSHCPQAVLPPGLPAGLSTPRRAMGRL